MIVSFSDTKKLPPISLVGGKGFNLIKMCSQGLNVPSGFILTTEFFKPWFSQLQQTKAWQTFIAKLDQIDSLQQHCEELKMIVGSYTFNQEQHTQLALCLERYQETNLFAVRSSSPEEDGETASFAGLYETVLGVPKSGLLDAVRTTFASCLDYRLLRYKIDNHYDVLKPGIAVVIQIQIDSESAGVAFSLNPITNDYDEVVINSNFGLGESVVSGLATPDNFVINKHTQGIVSKISGLKEQNVRLQKTGVNTEKKHCSTAQFSLSDVQILELAQEIQKIESYYQQPLDIEWALVNGCFYFLQARAITSYNIIPEKLLTHPLEKRRVYFDITLSVQGFHKSLSPLSSDIYRYVINAATFEFVGRNMTEDVSKALPFCASGRLYLNLSNMLNLLPADIIIQFISCMDGLAASALEQAELDRFRHASFKKTGLIWAALIRFFPRIKTYFVAFKNPNKTRANIDDECLAFQNRVRVMNSGGQTMQEFVKQVTDQSAVLVLQKTEPAYVAAKVAMSKIRRLFPNADQEQIEMINSLDQSLPGNITTEMGHDLFLLSRQLNAGFSSDTEALYRALQQEKLGNQFQQQWLNFMLNYGHRCAEEIELAQQRFRDNPTMLLNQIQEFKKITNPDQSPIALFEAAQIKRQVSAQKLEMSLNPRRKKKFQGLVDVVINLGGLRETHKYNVMYGLDVIRSDCLKIAKQWVKEKRIDQTLDIFDLRLADIQRGRENSTLNLGEILNTNRAYFRKLNQSRQQFPVFDSRGRFYKPNIKNANAGEIIGQSISSGIVTGKVKVMRTADEKKLHTGEILVARATDPGWTPLFINAAAIILEVGGPLQHGAVIAREYGKPCISGIQGVTEKFFDGEWVTVDGGLGIVKKEKQQQ